MKLKSIERQRALALRRMGKTYIEILKAVPVAKSTLSLWLRSEGLSSSQKHRITKRKVAAARRGAAARREMRLAQIRELTDSGVRDVDAVTPRELWLMGIALYWAEGSKQRESNASVGIHFSNSDVRMIRVFLQWLLLVGIPASDIVFELYVHDNRKDDIPRFRDWWGRELGLSAASIDRVYLKKAKIKSHRVNSGDLYRGLIRIKVRTSTTLNRRVNGWIEGIVAATLGDRLMVGQVPLKHSI